MTEALLKKLEEARLPRGPKIDWSQAASDARKAELVRLVAEAQELGIYPRETVPGNPNSVLTMVECYGARWFEWCGPLNCPHCKADLRSLDTGPPYKREIGMYDRDRDRTSHFVCPDCQGVILR